MATATVPLDLACGEIDIIHDATWDLYLQALDEIVDRPALRVSYGDGCLQIMSVSAKHDGVNRTMARIVDILAAELELDAKPLGSTTFKRDDLRKGFEADSSFYFSNASKVRGKDEIDLSVDPAPELVIEVDITSSSIPRFSIYASVGVAEVWRYAKGRVRFHLLEDGRYVESPSSGVFPFLTSEAVTRLVEAESTLPFPEWKRRVVSIQANRSA